MAPSEEAGAYAISNSSTLAREAGVSQEAVDLLRSCEVIDLHIESFIPPRLWGYDLNRRHGLGALGGRLFGHLDFPRALDGGLTGAMWSISTNITKGAKSRLRALKENVASLRGALLASGGRLIPVRTYTEYQAARSKGAHAALLAVQGGNAYEAVEGPPSSADGGWVTRVTVVHLSNSVYGATSSPARVFGGDRGLTERGRELVAKLNSERVFVDLAHISERGFWEAMEVQDRTQPVIVTHTGVDGVCPHWRNLTDAQLRAVADTGGVVGVIFQAGFLRRRSGPRDGRMVVEHILHVIDVAGEDAVAIGSDYDGFIVPPPDLRDGRLGYVRLVQYLLDAGVSERQLVKLLGQNFLASLRELRP